MRLKELPPGPEDSFEHCKLGRKKYAEVLTNIVGNYPEGFVLAINNEWGAGKTTFLRMWEAELKQKEFTTIYFNAWENDFDNQPLVALIGELKSIIRAGNDKAFNSLLEKGAIISKAVIPAVIKTIIEKQTGINDFAEVFSKAAEGTLEIFKEEVSNYAAKKEGIKDFKVKLEEFVKQRNSDKPLIFIIDELDRCRPDYAVSLLEQIKHFFSVNGIVFVLSIDKKQLGHAVQGVYGSEQINAEEYLRRFIDFEFKLPAPETKAYIKYLCSAHNFLPQMFSAGRHFTGGAQAELNGLIEAATLFFDGKNLPLRFQEKVFAHASLSLKSLASNEFFPTSLFIILVFIRQKHETLFDQISQKQLSEQELLDNFYVVSPKVPDSMKRYFMSLESQLLFYYSNHVSQMGGSNLTELQGGQITSRREIQSKFDTSGGQALFLKELYDLKNLDNSTFSIKTLLDKISITDNISI